MRRVLVLSVLLLCAGCGGSSSHPAITASPRSGLLDAPPRIRVSGVRDGAVERARTVDDSGQRWASTTRVADLRRDPTRLLWTLRHGQDFFLPPSAGFVVRLGAAVPYLPTQSPPRYGGSPAADVAAKAALWPASWTSCGAWAEVERRLGSVPLGGESEGVPALMVPAGARNDGSPGC